MRHGVRATLGKTGIYIVCIFLAILSILPFYIMIVNATRSTYEIQQTAITLIPSKFIASNWAVFEGISVKASLVKGAMTQPIAVYIKKRPAFTGRRAFTCKIPAAAHR